MRGVAGAALLAAVALAACGGDDDGGGELTPDHLIAALREANPQCEQARVRKNGPDVSEIRCGNAFGLLYSRHPSPEAAESFAQGSGPTAYTSGRYVIQSPSVADPDRFIDEVRARCDCEIKAH